MEDRNILITGGTGTLGQALVAEYYEHNQLTIYSRSELKQARMRHKWPECRYILGDVRDFRQLDAAIAGHDTVIHAAAMKRIPECEEQPSVCYETNVIGSDNVVHACVLHGVTRCVGISTDKACMPVTAYGASKLMMEKIFQAHRNGCIFTLVRYGNVLESNGSVIKLWRKCLAQGEPLPITHGQMTRFWMTPREAIKGINGALQIESGQVFVPKCRALGIAAMARWVAPGAETVEIGLRSMERMHEYLVTSDEFVTEHQDYFILGGGGVLGAGNYTSLNAPSLSRSEFEAMLAEVDNG